MLHTMKRCIALLLALSMCFSLLSTGAWAADTSGDADISGDVSIVNNEGDGSTSEEASAPEEAPKEAPDESGPEESKEEPQEAPKLTDERKEKVGKSVKESKEAEEAPKESEEQSEETPAPKALKSAKGGLRTQGSVPAPLPVSYLEWDEGKQKLVEPTGACTEYTVVTDQTTWGTAGQDTWYVVKDTVTISDRITVNDEVNLILCDGAKLTASKGITVATGTTLNIYAQSAGTGELSADASSRSSEAGIGGDSGHGGGTVNIHGGKITANGGEAAAGIGGGDEGSGGDVTIYGGVVTATGGTGAEGIGHGGSDSGDSGSLNVDNGLKVFGGTGSASMEVIEETDNDYHREQYMEVFAPVASVTSGSTTSYYSVFNDTDGGSTNDAVHAWLNKGNGAQLKLLDDVTTSSTITVTGDATKTLDLNGFGIRMTGSDRVITVNGGATLNLYDCDETEHSYSTATDLAEVDATFNNAHPTFKGGYITGGNISNGHGGGVYNEGTFNMYGGNIVGNKADVDGGGVLNAGTFTMSGGSITGNTAGNEGGYITGGNATNGGGVVVNGGTFTMSGGNIVGNTAGNGGGVYVDRGTFTMSGGEITGNKANNDFGNGGGVNNNFDTFTMLESVFVPAPASVPGLCLSRRGGYWALTDGRGAWS